jgi:hypothetical protein
VQDNPELHCNFNKLINMSLASSTWSKHSTGLKCFGKYEDYVGRKCVWPVTIQDLRSFTVWCVSVRNLSSATAKSYLYSISLAHKLKDLHCPDYLSDKVLNLILTGAENKKDLCNPSVSKRRAMSYSTLLIIGHKIANSEWSDYNKQVLWSACTFAFFTSVRLGEILAKKVRSFDKDTTLLWNNVKFMNNNEILVYLPFTKTTKCKGDFIDVFPLGKENGCPVQALKKLMALTISAGKFSMQNPVFVMENGSNLTTSKLNAVLKNLLSDIFDPERNSISCHSFRCAIPSVLNEHPKIFTLEEIKSWGRWVGSSYLLYLRLHREKRRALFRRIENVL